MSEEAPVWEREYLATLRFDTNRECFDQMRIQALRSGFDIASRQPLIYPYGTFYCTRGGRVRSRTTSKCGCTFQFKTTVDRQQKVVIRIDESLELNHNHELSPRIYRHRLIPPEVQDLIRELHNAKVKPTQIKSFLERKGHFLSTIQIQYLVRTTQVHSFQAESEELIEFVNRDPEALTRVFEKEVEGQRHRFAVLTFTEQELENLKRFGDVLFIDGTFAQLRLRWEVLPITAVNQHSEIVSCGIMYSSMTNEETLSWLLCEIWRIIGPLGILKTIITDEDHAFIAAFRSFMTRVNEDADEPVVIHHALCALHKQRNFMKKLQKCGLSQTQQEIALNLFRKICYHTNLDYVNYCLDELSQMNARLSHYLDKHVRPALQQFSRAYMSGVYANGYNTTSPGESMNNMLKQGLRAGMTLVESREHFSAILENHEQNGLIKRSRMRLPVDSEEWMLPELWREVGFKTANKICKQCRLIEEIVIEEEEDHLFTHRAFHENHPDIIYRLNEDYCDCNTIMFLGIPCCHLLKLHYELGRPFPEDMINPRWRLEISDVGDDWADQRHSPASTSESDETELDAELRTRIQEEEDEHDLPSREADSQKQLYLKIFHIGKQIARISCQNPETGARISAQMKGILAELIEQPPEGLPNESEEIEQDREVIDVVDVVARPRGRPRRIGSWSVERRPRGTCGICDGDHATLECVGYAEMRAAVEEHAGYDGPMRQCGICKAPGHNKRTCAIRLSARRHYRQSEG